MCEKINKNGLFFEKRRNFVNGEWIQIRTSILTFTLLMYFVLVSSVWKACQFTWSMSCEIGKASEWCHFTWILLHSSQLTIHTCYCWFAKREVIRCFDHLNFKDQRSNRFESREKHFSDFLYTFSVPSNILMSCYLIKSITIFINFFIVSRCQLLKIIQISKKCFKLFISTVCQRAKHCCLGMRNLHVHGSGAMPIGFPFHMACTCIYERHLT